MDSRNNLLTIFEGHTAKLCTLIDAVSAAEDIKGKKISPRSLKCKPYAERYVRSVGIWQTTERADQCLETAQRILHAVPALLGTPQAAYEEGHELVRVTLNRAFFTELYGDGERVAEYELRESFEMLVGAHRQYVTVRRDALPNALTLEFSGWSNATVVDDTGIEPVTSSVSGKRSPAELIVRDWA